MVEGPQSIKDGSDILGLQAHVAHKDGLCKPRTLVGDTKERCSKTLPISTQVKLPSR